jgi:hypothetical protein
LLGLRYTVIITDTVMFIGCERHLLADWRSFDDERIKQMDGDAALEFWRENKDLLFSLADKHIKSGGQQ